jgi:Fusaric acid resistance protein-like
MNVSTRESKSRCDEEKKSEVDAPKEEDQMGEDPEKVVKFVGMTEDTSATTNSGNHDPPNTSTTCPIEEKPSSSATASHDETLLTRPNTRARRLRWRRAQFWAFARSLLEINWSEVALTPALRTSTIIMLEWIIFGIGNSNSTAFQLGALLTGLSDANGNLGQRLHGMGLTLFMVVFMGTWLPSVLYGSMVGSILAALAVSFLTGCSPFLGDPTLLLSMKLGLALFAIQGGIHRRNDGETRDVVLWTFFGGSCSLLAALLPEIIGNRDAIRTDLFKVWHGFGCILGKWNSQWGTYGHTGRAPVPYVTLSICNTIDLLENDDTEDRSAKKWLLEALHHVDAIRTATLCLSNGYEMERHRLVKQQGAMHEIGTSSSLCHEYDEKIDEFFGEMAALVKVLGFAFQFPWLVRFIPVIRVRIQQKEKLFQKSTEWFLPIEDVEGVADPPLQLSWLTPLVRILRSELEDSVRQVLDLKHWPKFSSPTTILSRVISAFPCKLPTLKEDPDWTIRGYAIRLAFAFTVATVVEILMHEDASAHWFPMTVAFIMGPSEASTYEKVAHRTIGTLFGVALGSLIAPLFAFPAALILLLGLNTFAVRIFFTSNYALFTFFITSWVFCTTVGTGAPKGVTVFYRCMWTLAAAFTVTIVTYIHPPHNQSQLTKLLAGFAQSVLEFSEAVVREHHLLSNADDQSTESFVEKASQQVIKTKKNVIEKRLAFFTYIHDAVLTPTGGCRIDPHTVAPQVASDLIDAGVISLFLSLVKDGCDHFWSDLEDLSELERLVNRLEAETEGTCSEKPSKEGSPASPSATSNSDDFGPFATAVAAAHGRLDAVGVPPGSI